MDLPVVMRTRLARASSAIGSGAVDRFFDVAARVAEVGIAILSFVLLASTTAFGQVNSYYANDGTNGLRNTDYGELGRDVLGNIPLLLEGSSVYANNWNSTSPSFLDALRAHATDLNALNSDVLAYCTLTNRALVPFDSAQVILEPTWAGGANPKTRPPGGELGRSTSTSGPTVSTAASSSSRSVSTSIRLRRTSF